MVLEVNSFYKFMIKKYFNRADHIVTVSNGVKHDLIDKFKVNRDIIDVLYNPLDINEIINYSKEILTPEFNLLFENNFTIMNIGNINVAKGHWNLIRAFSLVKKEILNAKLIIIGKADPDSELLIQNLISDLGLEESVHLLGYQKNPYKFLGQSDVFAFSSIYEGFGISVVEALACSVPVISTDCKSGPREILAPSTDFRKITDQIEYADYGILTPPSQQGFLNASIPLTTEEKLLSDAIITLFHDKEMQSSYSRKGLQRAFDFGLDKAVQNYVNLFEDVLTK